LLFARVPEFVEAFSDYAMPEHTQDPSPEAPQAPAARKSRGKLFLIAGILFVVLLAGGGAAFWMMQTPAEAAEATDAAPKARDLSAAGMVTFEPFIVNLADSGAKRFLRINVALIVASPEEAEHIQKSEVVLMQLRSDILDLLSEQTSEVIVSADGKAALKAAIAERANPTVGPAAVDDVLFSDFVVQY
jgi:flagellar FliL protein